MTRVSIDWDGDGAFAVITRPSQPTEVVRLLSTAPQRRHLNRTGSEIEIE